MPTRQRRFHASFRANRVAPCKSPLKRLRAATPGAGGALATTGAEKAFTSRVRSTDTLRGTRRELTLAPAPQTRRSLARSSDAPVVGRIIRQETGSHDVEVVRPLRPGGCTRSHIEGRLSEGASNLVSLASTIFFFTWSRILSGGSAQFEGGEHGFRPRCESPSPIRPAAH